MSMSEPQKFLAGKWGRPYGAPSAAPLRDEIAAALVERVIGMVAEHFLIGVGDIRARDRHQHIANPRHVAAWVLRDLGFSYPAVARALARTDHTTPLSSVRRVEATPALHDIAKAMAGHARAIKAELYFQQRRDGA